MQNSCGLFYRIPVFVFYFNKNLSDKIENGEICLNSPFLFFRKCCIPEKDNLSYCHDENGY